MKIFLVVAILFLTVSAEAKPIPAKVNLLVCTSAHPYAMSRRKALNAWEDSSKQIYDELKVNLRVVSLQVRPCNLPTYYQELYNGNQFDRVLRFFKQKPGVYNFAILPGVSTDSDSRGMGGVSNGFCGLTKDWNLAIAALPDDVPLRVASTTISHEMGHQLGCHHVESYPPTIMHPNVAFWVWGRGKVRFGKECRSEALQCFQSTK